MADKPELVTICETQGLLTAEVLKSKLESAGIPVLLRYESAGWILGVTVDGLGKVQVQVPLEFESEALELIDEEAEDAPVEE